MANKIITIVNKLPDNYLEAIATGIVLAVAYWNLDRRLRKIDEHVDKVMDTVDYIRVWK